MSPPCRVRDELLSVAGRLARDGETQLKQSPENPGRFSIIRSRTIGRSSVPSSQRCEAGHAVSQPAAAATLTLGLHQSANGIAPY